MKILRSHSTAITFWAAASIVTFNSANAETVRVDFVGEVTNATGVFADEVVPNNTVTGFIVISTGFVPFNPMPNPVSASYLAADTPAANEVWEISISYGSEQRTTADNARPVNSNHHSFQTNNLPSNPGNPDDLAIYNSFIEAAGDDVAEVRFQDDDLFGSFVSTVPNILSVSFIQSIVDRVNSPIEATRTNQGFYSAIDVNNGLNQNAGLLEWSITSASLAVLDEQIPTEVPIGSSLVLLLSSLFGLGAMRRGVQPT